MQEHILHVDLIDFFLHLLILPKLVHALIPEKVQLFIEPGDLLIGLQLLINILVFILSLTQLAGHFVHHLFKYSVEAVFLMLLKGCSSIIEINTVRCRAC